MSIRCDDGPAEGDNVIFEGNTVRAGRWRMEAKSIIRCHEIKITTGIHHISTYPSRITASRNERLLILS